MSAHIPRLWVPHSLTTGGTLQLGDAARLHHLRDVLRLGVGDTVRLFNTSAGEFQATVQALDKKQAQLAVQEQVQMPQTAPALHLYFAPLKRQALEWLVEKTAELGVSHFHPVITAHTQVRDINTARLQAIALAAVEQCGRLQVPEFHAPMPLLQLPPSLPAPSLWVAAESTRASAPLMQTLAPDVHDTPDDAASAILIGPEGGFSADELAWLQRRKDTRLVSLGPAVLRAETAAVLACGAVMLQNSSKRQA